jgi:hypothetical protein
VQGDAFVAEVEQRWRESCDRAWRRKWGRLLLALGGICGACAVVGYFLIGQQVLRMNALAAIPGNANVSPRFALAAVFVRLASIAYPAGLIYGVLRARRAALPAESSDALNHGAVFAIQLRAIRHALYWTVLPVVLVPIATEALLRGVLLGFTPSSAGLPPTSFSFDPLLGGAGTAWGLLISWGWLLCLLEWQAILLSRFPPRANLAWLQAVPYLLPWAGMALRYLAAHCLARISAAPAGPKTALALLSYNLPATALLMMAVGLAAAPFLWRWAASGRLVSRWVVVTLCCLAAVCLPRAYCDPLATTAAPSSILVSSLGSGLYLGNSQPPFTGGGRLRDNPLEHDLLGVWLAPEDADANGSDPWAPYRTPGLGVLLTNDLFIPWYLALIWLVLYYAYSYSILRRAAQLMPAGEQHSPEPR